MVSEHDSRIEPVGGSATVVLRIVDTTGNDRMSPAVMTNGSCHWVWMTPPHSLAMDEHTATSPAKFTNDSGVTATGVSGERLMETVAGNSNKSTTWTVHGIV